MSVHDFHYFQMYMWLWIIWASFFDLQMDNNAYGMLSFPAQIGNYLEAVKKQQFLT